MNDFELKATTHRRFPNARSLLRAASRLAVLATAVLIVASVSNTAARADTPVKRDIWNIGNPLVLPITPAQLAEDRRFRQAAGFRSDDAYIAALYDQVARGALPGASRNWAALLTADEAANMTGRQQLAEIVGPAPLGAVPPALRHSVASSARTSMSSAACTLTNSPMVRWSCSSPLVSATTSQHSRRR